jgi:hypothetical protein
MGHSLHNRIQTKSSFSAARVQALAMIGGFAGVAIACVLVQLLRH